LKIEPSSKSMGISGPSLPSSNNVTDRTTFPARSLHSIMGLGLTQYHCHMTAIIGFNCHDSVLMMADTEESTTQGKSSCDKLYHFASPSGYVLTGGAGDAHLIDCANQRLRKFFAAGLPGTPPDDPVTPQLVLDGLSIFAQQLFTETTETYHSVGLDPLHEFELLIAVNILKKGTYLFKLYLNEVLWIDPPNHKVIGSGELVIHPMLRDFQVVPQKETALFCGTRMMYRAKNTVPGVSGKTDAVALLNNGSLCTTEQRILL
jgi:hypothetical protein